MSTELEKWLKTRPPVIQQMAKDYPDGWYIMTDDAPYGISAPKTKVELIGWTENKELIVVVHPEHRTDPSLLHEATLRIVHPNHKATNESAIQVTIDPQYVKKI